MCKGEYPSKTVLRLDDLEDASTYKNKFEYDFYSFDHVAPEEITVSRNDNENIFRLYYDPSLL